MTAALDCLSQPPDLAGAGLTLLACAAWPERDDDAPPPPIAGFIESSFSPLVAEVARRCLTPAGVVPPAQTASEPVLDERTAIVLTSVSGDLATAAAVARAVDAGTRVAPLLFFQSVPNAVAGLVASRWGLAGPVVCLSPAPLTSALSSADLGEIRVIEDQLARTSPRSAGNMGAGLGEGVAAARLLIDDGEADRALVIAVEQASQPAERDWALAVLVAGRPATDHVATGRPATGHPATDDTPTGHPATASTGTT